LERTSILTYSEEFQHVTGWMGTVDVVDVELVVVVVVVEVVEFKLVATTLTILFLVVFQAGSPWPIKSNAFP
jgi:hypothetical protein